MITIKQYAEARGKSVQAVYKAMKSKKNKERLQGHIERIEGKQWLDDIAVQILDESRADSPVIYVEDNREEQIKQYREEVEKYKSLVIELQRQLLEKQEQLSSVKDQARLLESKEQERIREVDRLQEELEREQNKTWWDKLLKR